VVARDDYTGRPQPAAHLLRGALRRPARNPARRGDGL